MEDKKRNVFDNIKLIPRIIKNLFKLTFRYIFNSFKNANLQVALTYFLIFAFTLTFYYSKIKIPKLEANIRQATIEEFDFSSVSKQKVVSFKKDIGYLRSSTILKGEVLDMFELVELPAHMVTDDMVPSIELMNGKILNEKLNPGEFVFFDNLSDNTRWLKDFNRLKEYPVKTLVDNEVNEGNYVDVIVNYSNGDYDIVMPRTKVERIRRTGDGYSDYIVVFSVDEEDYRDMELAKLVGYLETRLYEDIEQIASKKTFVYSDVIDRHKEMLKNITTPTKTIVEDYNDLTTDYNIDDTSFEDSPGNIEIEQIAPSTEQNESDNNDIIIGD